jgi:hypothetical protein
MLARDEREDLRSGTGVVEGQKGDGQPVERSKPRVGHGGQIFCGYTAAESGKRMRCEI